MFEKAGTMTGGGARPRGGKMGTSIRATVSGEAVANAEKELSDLVEHLTTVRSKLKDAVKCYRDSEKAISPLEMELAKSQKEVNTPFKILLFFVLHIFVDVFYLTYVYHWQIGSLKLLLGDLEKQLDSLKAASEPTKEEVDRLEEIANIISAEEKEIDRLTNCSKQLKAKVTSLRHFCPCSYSSFFLIKDIDSMWFTNNALATSTGRGEKFY